MYFKFNFVISVSYAQLYAAQMTSYIIHSFYPHTLIGKVWIYRLLFVCVCMVTDFSAKDKASSVKFCMVVHRHSRQGIFHFGELFAIKSPKSDESA